MSLLRLFGRRTWGHRQQVLPKRKDSQRSTIPRYLHFVWGLLDGAGTIPDPLNHYYQQWMANNAGWDVRIHGRESINSIVGAYPQIPFEAYSKDIQRCDACRPMLLHEFGGVYSDLDVEPHRPLDELFLLYPHANVLLVEETALTKRKAKKIGREEPIRRGVPELPLRISNYFMATIPGHPFWLDVLELMRQRCGLPVCNDYDVLYTTGPDIITEVAHCAVKRYSDVVIVPKDVVDEFITHHCNGSWRGT